MKISIIVPVYNAEEYLSKCLESLVNQTYRNIEIILVDDGSTDASPQMCDEYAQKDDRIIVIHKENEGLSLTRNVGMAAITGDFFTFVDSDDWLSYNYVEKLVVALEANDIDIVFTSYLKEYKSKSVGVTFFPEDEIIFKSSEGSNEVLRRLVGEIGDELQHPERIENLNTAWGKCYRTSKFKQLKFDDGNEIRSEDLWFNIQAFYLTERSIYINNQGYHYNKQNENSIVSTYTPHLADKFNKLNNMIEDFIGLHKLGEDYILALNSRRVLMLLTIAINEFSNQKISFWQRTKKMKTILNGQKYTKAFREFEYGKLSCVYRIFFKACEKKQAMIVGLIISMALFKRKRLG